MICMVLDIFLAVAIFDHGLNVSFDIDPFLAWYIS